MLGMFFFFFFNDTATTEIYTLSLHDALPISLERDRKRHEIVAGVDIEREREWALDAVGQAAALGLRSEEHTSELQSLAYLVCRLLLEKKKIHIGRSASSMQVLRVGSCDMVVL